MLKGDIKIIREYLEQLKTLGVYDNTTIIITADHGHVKYNTVLEMKVAGGCIMLVKPAGADSSKPIVTSLAPVSHADLFATAIKGLGGDATKYGKAIYEIPENEKRDRYYYYTALYTTTDGEVVLREYLIDGPADKLSSYKLTGNNWDMDYSMYAVSKERFEE